ncbi:hypothetical protein [Conexibacter sp. SYSU D00693]|uniref:hypothetical protein n=1 Tax=Conexibacter sp. SYSU D00693 TaxID=2812560 RepID=UPI00196AF988|nr:hypothetical protein [Conexibacter sp. SYSU D00693]
MKETNERLALGDTSWLPDLVGDKRLVVHLSIDGDLPRAFSRRLVAAAAAEHRVAFATGATGLELSTMQTLQNLDARVWHVDLTRSPVAVERYRSVADWVAGRRVSMTPAEMVVLVNDRLADGAGDGTNAARGRWYEEALCLLFSQVSWLEVEEHAYRNASEEIDIVMSSRAAGHVAQLIGGPVVIATAKNEATPTGSDVVKYLKEQMANRKGRCKLGFLCSSSTISKDAVIEILRGSQGNDAVIVPIDRDVVEGLLSSPDDLDARFERLILEAVDA